MGEQQSSVDDMFSEEPARPEPPLAAPTRSSRKKPLFIYLGVTIVGLIALWWFSSLQHDRYFILVENNALRVERGYFFPFGHGAWSPNRAYKPLDLPRGIRPKKTGAMSIDELDHALMNLFVKIAKSDLRDLSSGDLDRAEEMIWRAQKLSTVTIQDDRRLLKMLGDVAFRRGLSEMKGILERFDEAMKHFRLSAMRGGDTYPDGERWANAIGRLKNEFRELAIASDMKPEEALGGEVKQATPPPIQEPAVEMDKVEAENEPEVKAPTEKEPMDAGIEAEQPSE